MHRTDFLRSFCALLIVVFLSASASAQSQGFFFDDRTAFEKASERVRTIDFESAAPDRGFGKYAPDVGLSLEGIDFRTSGGARFGSGTIFLPSRDYTALNPGMKMLDGAHLAWGAPNQPGNAHLELTLRGGVNAFGVDIWTMQPIVSPIAIEIRTRDGRAHVSTVITRKRPESAFVGFVSDSEIASVRFTPAKGQSTLLLDNLAYGRHAKGADLAALAAKSQPEVADVEGVRSPTSPRPPTMQVDRKTSAVNAKSSVEEPTPTPPDSLEPVRPENKSRPAEMADPTTPASGSIAYVKGQKEIRLISPDGSNDRVLWKHADAHAGLGINQLAWKPDGSELAFSSSHESVASFYHADIFAIKSNGTGVRKITNGPNRSDYPKYGKGTVTVTVRNEQPIYQTTKASAGIFFVYVMGADLPQAITLPPGSSKTLTFKDVADFGDHAQAVVAVYGANRWFIPGTDVKAGRVIKAPDFAISGDGIELFGAFRPVWKRDGSRISYRNGLCIVSSISSAGHIGHSFDPMFKGENAPKPCAWDWGPTPETADQLLYPVITDDEIIIYRRKGESTPEKVTSLPKEKYQFLNDLEWLPDGSGFLVSASELAYGYANVLRYDLATRRTSAITNFEDTFVKDFTISPDGKWIAFERTKGFVDDDADIWVVGTDGKGLRLLAKSANHPAWGK